jgi:hypothetical protein
MEGRPVTSIFSEQSAADPVLAMSQVRDELTKLWARSGRPYVSRLPQSLADPDAISQVEAELRRARDAVGGREFTTCFNEHSIAYPDIAMNQIDAEFERVWDVLGGQPQPAGEHK